MSKKTEKIIHEIKREIDERLRLRCINVQTTLTAKEVVGEGVRLILESTPFNTVPVIHSPMTITDFGGMIAKDKKMFACDDDGNVTEYRARPFYIRVSASYNGNSESLFKVRGTIHDRDGRDAYVYIEDRVTIKEL